METIWKPKTNYFIKLPKEKLLEVLDDMLVDIMGYDPEKAWTLGDVNGVCRSVKYLKDDEVAISIQICSSNPNYINHKLKNGNTINTFSVQDHIDPQDFALAKYYFQVDEFMSEEEYKDLISIEN